MQIEMLRWQDAVSSLTVCTRKTLTLAFSSSAVTCRIKAPWLYEDKMQRKVCWIYYVWTQLQSYKITAWIIGKWEKIINYIKDNMSLLHLIHRQLFSRSAIICITNMKTTYLHFFWLGFWFSIHAICIFSSVYGQHLESDWPMTFTVHLVIQLMLRDFYPSYNHGVTRTC